MLKFLLKGNSKYYDNFVKIPIEAYLNLIFKKILKIRKLRKFYKLKKKFSQVSKKNLDNLIVLKFGKHFQSST